MRPMAAACCGMAALALAACASGERDGQTAAGVDGLKQCVRDEINEARGAAHQSVLGELAVAHCADDIYRAALAEKGGLSAGRAVVMDRARELEAELRAFAVRYAMGLES